VSVGEFPPVSHESPWRGIFPSLCTPFREDGNVDLDAQRRIVRFAIDGGAHGLVCFGLAGEVGRLAVDERRALAEAIVDETAGRVPVLLGVGAESAAQSRRLAEHAESVGASAIVIASPTGGQLPGGDLARHLADIAGAVDLPVMIQEAGVYLGVSLSPVVVRDAAELSPNVRLVKIEAGPVEMRRWIDELGAGFDVWGGDGGVYQRDCLAIGAAGIVPGVELVDLLVDVYEADGDDGDGAVERFEALLPTLVFEMQSIDVYVACAKRILTWRGVLAHPTVRAPAPSFRPDLDRLLRRHLATLGIPLRD
jgi:4-hydroxy-tetrahydrodipicolinate synthase